MSAFSLIATLSLSTFICLLSIGTFLWTSSNILLASVVLSSITTLLTYVFSFLIMVYQKKTGNEELNWGCCNVFNVVMMVIYVLFVGSFLATFCGFIHSFVSDPIVQYIVYAVYGAVLLPVILGSIVILCTKKVNRIINEEESLIM